MDIRKEIQFIMENGDLKDYINKLKELEKEMSDGDGEDLSFISELDSLLKQLTTDIQDNYAAAGYTMEVKVKKLEPNAVIPSYSKDGDAGMDLTITSIISETTSDITYGFGLAMEIPKGFVGLVFPRSSIRKTDLLLTNSVGVIDCVPSGTKITTVDGDINVEDLFENMTKSILSYNEELNSIEIDRITDMWIVENKDLLKITTEDNDIIELPYEKEVFTKSGWKKVIDLTENDEILRII